MKGEIKPERWQQIEQLFNSVLELEPEQREGFLKEACAGDGSLQKEVERLLGRQQQAEEFIESPALEVAARALAKDPRGKLNPDLSGQSLSHYRVKEKIGEGGMGQVYRAFDDHLQRDVAIKVLPTGTLADETSRQRFHQEALALSKLNHPNIATIHDFDTQQGVDYLVMEYISGMTLSERLATGPLPEKEIAVLGAQLAMGLEAAHLEGVIHRDLKPGNLRLTPDGRLKILDFGLAKLIHPDKPDKAAESEAPTQGVAGTLPYMAPEQLRAEPLDARTDLYSAGVVLYEMITGERAFQETVTPRLIDAILHQALPPPSALNRHVSAGLENIILKCVEKDPENRYQSAKEFAVDLRRLLSPTSTTHQVSFRRRTIKKRVVIGAVLFVSLFLALGLGLDLGGLRDRFLRGMGRQTIHSLAVLPLVNFSHDPEQEYFADGMTESLITELSKIKSLNKVISRTSVMQYKGTKRPIPQIAKELGVDAVIEGSAMRDGNMVRISVQLIQGSTDAHLWADSFDREYKNILALHTDVARKIAQQVNVTLSPEEAAGGPTRVSVVDPAAYDLYLQGRFCLNKRNKGEMEKAWGYFQQAIDKEPTYAPAWAGLADTLSLLRSVGYWEMKPEEVQEKSLQAAMKAVELDDSLAEGHAALGRIYFIQRKWTAAGKELQRAIALNPNEPTAHQRYAFFLLSVGRQDEGLSEIRKAEQVDPRSMVIQVNLANHLWCLHRGDEAISVLRRAIELDPQFANTHEFLRVIYEDRGRFREAIQEFEKFHLLLGEKPEQVQRMATSLRDAYKAGGARGYWLKSMELVTQGRQEGEDVTVEFATTYAQLGDVEQALQWLMKGCRQGEDIAVTMRGPEMDNVRAHPRFREILDCLGLER